MDRVLSIEDSVVSMVKDFFENIDKREPFYAELTQYKFMLKSKLTQILSQFGGDYETGTKSFSSAVEAIWKALEGAVDKVDLEKEKQLERVIQALDATGQVLKEFLYDERIKDKEILSTLLGRIGETTEKLSYEMRRRTNILKRIKKLFGL